MLHFIYYFIYFSVRTTSLLSGNSSLRSISWSHVHVTSRGSCGFGACRGRGWLFTTAVWLLTSILYYFVTKLRYLSVVAFSSWHTEIVWVQFRCDIIRCSQCLLATVAKMQCTPKCIHCSLYTDRRQCCTGAFLSMFVLFSFCLSCDDWLADKKGWFSV